MGEPLARTDGSAEGAFTDAAHRLERALETLEAALDGRRTSPFTPAGATAVVVELEAARWRNRELETAATAASRALGMAMKEVRQALEEDEPGSPDPQTSLFDSGLFDSPLESDAGLADDPDEPATEKEPTA